MFVYRVLVCLRPCLLNISLVDSSRQKLSWRLERPRSSQVRADWDCWGHNSHIAAETSELLFCSTEAAAA